ncbi:exodeoxyribonuclease VII large subunit [Sphingomonas sp. 1P06PA]|uniref:exodeoxyribonuclease VII large subunit n=1 Tax=Sphingomonas sp. 1P06PA TaxID=554121 RepID=UPI0039A724AF
MSDTVDLIAADPPGANDAALSVSELSGALKRSVEDAFGHVRVRGEVSGFKRHASGHCYLTLKDDRACIDGVIWKGQAAAMRFRPEDGIEVIATGRLTTYPGRSKYQIVIDRLELAGAGALMALLDQRRRALAAEGLFDETAKRTLPALPRVIGVVTSPTGAVIRDILHRLADRFPSHVLVWPVAVQGEGAAAQVAAAVRGFGALPMGSAIPRPDLLIVARGGGSIEDLWAFNEEAVVRAVAESPIPVISAVGHETDTTLCDFAADRRAPTPTAAAEMAVPVRAQLAERVTELGLRSGRCVRRYQERAGERLEAVARRLPAPESLLGPQTQRVDDAGARLPRGLERRLALASAQLARTSGALRPALIEQRIARAADRLQGLRFSRAALDRRLAEDGRRLAQLGRLLGQLDPDAPLGRGYVKVERRDGAVLTSAAEARAAGLLTLKFADGAVAAKVEKPEGPAYHRSKPEQPSLF